MGNPYTDEPFYYEESPARREKLLIDKEVWDAYDKIRSILPDIADFANEVRRGPTLPDAYVGIIVRTLNGIEAFKLVPRGYMWIVYDLQGNQRGPPLTLDEIEEDYFSGNKATYYIEYTLNPRIKVHVILDHRYLLR